MLSLYTNLMIRLRSEEKGATAVEYGIMVGLIAVVIIVAVSTLGRHARRLLRRRQHRRSLDSDGTRDHGACTSNAHANVRCRRRTCTAHACLRGQDEPAPAKEKVQRMQNDQNAVQSPSSSRSCCPSS